jgi:[protein-PII] uridylyltransferase
MSNQFISESIVDEAITSAGLPPADGIQSHQRERLYGLLKQHPLTDIGEDEVEAHFRTMPKRYWDRVTKTELVWGLATVHAFLRKLAVTEFAASVLVADWWDCPERGFTKVMVCAWDRPGLLTKIAAAFSALRMNILRADVFTRADNLVLDVFEVCDSDHRHLADSSRLKHLVFLLEGALNEPPRFASIWAGEFHKTLVPTEAGPCYVDFDNDYSDEYTVVRIEARDRLGLLHDILQALIGCSVNIAQAAVETENNTARDLLYVTDFEGAKLRDTGRLESIRKALLRAINPDR